jgi:hypothetical protein
MPVLPDVGSMTTLRPGTSTPSRSAASTMALAIRSLTDPPADGNSTLPTAPHVLSTTHEAAAGTARTEVAPQAVVRGDLGEPDERRVADGVERVVEDPAGRHAAKDVCAVGGEAERVHGSDGDRRLMTRAGVV